MNKIHYLTAAVVIGISGASSIGQRPGAEEMPVIQEKGSSTDSTRSPRLILCINGRILEGVVSPHPEGGWNVEQKLGTIRVDSSDVEGIFSNTVEIYEHKREILPPRDIQERMRLYRWAMSHGLLDKSREQLQAVLAISPDHEEAKSLLGQLEIRIARQDSRRDTQVLQTSGRQTSAVGPREIDPAFLNRAMMDMALRNTPVIFDLPEPLALKRAQEFNQYIHPIVQRYCAGCHNERTPNGYPLVSALGRAARDPAILRSNLDATLSLVNPDNLMQSPLLTNSLLPHQPKNQPIFTGPNNAAYRLIANWVSNLQQRGYGALYSNSGSRSGESVSTSGESASFSQPPPVVQGGFATEREGGQPRTLAEQPVPIPLNPQVMQKSRFIESSPDQETAPNSAGQLIPGSYNGPSQEIPKSARFPVPLGSGGSPEELLKQLQQEETLRDAREAELSKLNDKKTVEPTPASDSGQAQKKSVKIDDKLLEQFILQRRGAK